MWGQRQTVQLDGVEILQAEIRLRDFERDNLSYLTAQRYVRDSRLLDDGLFEVSLGVEAALVGEKDDEFAGDPLKDVLLRLAVGVAFTHSELNRDLLGLRRVVVPPDNGIL